MKNQLRILCAVLCAVMVVSAIPFSVFALEQTQVEQPAQVQMTNGEAQEEEAADCMVVACDLKDSIVTVQYSSVVDCSLVVAVYDENNQVMVTSKSEEVSQGNALATLSFEGFDFPAYFYLRAYLVNSKTHHPLSKEFVNIDHSQQMQEFFAITPEDFNEEQVMTFDEQSDDFIVFTPGVKQVEYAEGYNTVLVADEETLTYTFENPSQQLADMQVGDVFAYIPPDGMLMVVKITAKTLEGNWVTFQGEDFEMEEVFEHIRVNEDIVADQPSAEQFDEQKSQESITEYMGSNHEDLNVETEQIQQHGTPFGGIGVYQFGNSIEEDIGSFEGEVDWGGEIGFTVEGRSEVCWNKKLDALHVLFRVDYSAGFNVHFSGNFTKEIPLFSKSPFQASVNGILFFGIEPELEISVSGELSTGGSVKGVWGFEYSPTIGKNNLTTEPVFDWPALAGGVTLEVGFNLQPKVTLIHEKLASLELDFVLSFGFKIENRFLGTDNYNQHSCKNCIGGTFFVGVDVEIEFESILLSGKNKEVKFPVFKKDWDVGEWYYSADYKKGGLTACPYSTFKNDIFFYDAKVPVIGYRFTLDGKTYTTNSNGMVSFWLPQGEYTIVIKGVPVVVEVDSEYKKHVVDITDKTYMPNDVFEYGGHYYRVYAGKYAGTWQTAKEQCEKMGGHLATITSAGENNAIAAKLTGDCYLIGGTDATTEGKWEWITGEKWSYQNWDSSGGTQEPNNGSGKIEQDWLGIFGPGTVEGNKAGCWDDTYNHIGVGFVCEWDRMVVSTKNDMVTLDILENIGTSFLVNVLANATADEDCLNGYSVQGKAVQKESKQQFTDCTPNGIYNYYVVKSEKSNGFLDETNLICVGQQQANAQGVLEFTLYNTYPSTASIVIREMERPTQEQIGGDLDYDQKVSSKDALLVLKYSVKKTSFTSWQKAMADVNMDQKINAVDALNILKKCVGKLDRFWNDEEYYIAREDTSYMLKVDGLVDSVITEDLSSIATFDVYINGARVANDVESFCREYPLGSTYEIADVRTVDGKQWDGFAKGEQAGFLTKDVLATLRISTVYRKVTVQGTLNGAALTTLPQNSLFDVYINGELYRENCTSFSQNFVYGTKYEIKNLCPGNGIGITSVQGALSATVTDGDAVITVGFEPLSQMSSYHHFQGHTYQRFDYGVSFLQAQQYCESLGGHLVTITSSQEQEFMKSVIGTNGKGGYWMGLEDPLTATQWITGEPLEYTNWNDGEPNNYYNMERYGQIYNHSYDYRWNDAQLYNRDRLYGMGFICEWDENLDNSWWSMPSDKVLKASVDTRYKGSAYLVLTAETVSLPDGCCVEYDVRFDKPNTGLGGVEVDIDGKFCRDTAGYTDQNNLSGHPAQNISKYAYNQWYHRVIPLVMADKEGQMKLVIAAELNTDVGIANVYYDNIRITKDGQTLFCLFDGELHQEILGEKYAGDSALDKMQLSLVSLESVQ